MNRAHHKKSTVMEDNWQESTYHLSCWPAPLKLSLCSGSQAEQRCSCPERKSNSVNWHILLFYVRWDVCVWADLYSIQQLAHAPEAISFDVSLGVQRQSCHLKVLHILSWNKKQHWMIQKSPDSYRWEHLQKIPACCSLLRLVERNVYDPGCGYKRKM